MTTHSSILAWRIPKDRGSWWASVCHTSVCSLVFILSQQRFGVTDTKAPLACHSPRVLDRRCYSSQVSNRPCYSSQTNQCYSSIVFRRQQENPSSRHEGTWIQRRQEKSAPAHGRVGERELALAPLFICFSLPGPVLCKLGQPGVLFVLPEVLTLVLGPFFVLFLQAFLFLIYQPPPFWTPFAYSNYLIVQK